MRLRFLLPLATLTLLVGCDTSECESSGLNCPPRPGEDSIVAGVNLNDLFASPTGPEIVAVETRWAGADTSAVLRDRAVIDLGDRESVRVVEGVSPAGVLFVGAIRQPPREAGDARRRPLLLVLGNEPDADVPALLETLAVRDDLRNEFVTLFLAYRGGTLRVGGQTFASPASPYTYAGDAKDALALVTGLDALGGVVGADRSRLGVIGHGRGGNVALLMAARAKARGGNGLPDYILSLAAPTSFFTPPVEASARRFLEGRAPGPIPGVGDVLAATAGRVRDGELTVEQARLELLRRSAAPFYAPPKGEPPPFIFAAYGKSGGRISLEDAKALDFLRADRGLYLEIEDATDDSIRRNGQVLSIGASFLCAYVLSESVGGCR